MRTFYSKLYIHSFGGNNCFYTHISSEKERKVKKVTSGSCGPPGFGGAGCLLVSSFSCRATTLFIFCRAYKSFFSLSISYGRHKMDERRSREFLAKRQDVMS